VSDPRTLEEKLREIADNDLYRAHAYGLHALADAVAALERENATLREQLASAKADGEALVAAIAQAVAPMVSGAAVDLGVLRKALVKLIADDAARAAGGKGGER
jgi:hypothetical protein